MTLVAIKINCGGADISPFVADVGFTGGTGYTGLSHSESGLSNPAPSGVYTSIRYAIAPGSFSYSRPVTANKRYRVRIHTNTGGYSNFQKVTINGVLAGSINAYVDSGNQADHGWITEYVIAQGASETMTLAFEDTLGSSDGARVCGIEILEIPPMSISTILLPEGMVGTPYTATLETADEDGDVDWDSIVGLPTGLAVNLETGVISGTPTAEALFPFDAGATDSHSTPQHATKTLSILIENAPAECLIDTLDDAPTWALANRKLLGSYAGPARRVKRISDGAELDIGFYDNGNLDQVAMIEHDDGHGLENLGWYDQMENYDLVADSSALPGVKYNHFSSRRAGIDFGDEVVNNLLMRSAGNITVTAPKVFSVVDVYSTEKGFQSDATFYLHDFGGQKFVCEFGHGAVNLYNGAAGFCGPFDGGKVQITTWFEAGADKVRINGVDKPASIYQPSFANSGDTARTGRLTIGNQTTGGTTNLQGVYGESIGYVGDCTIADRDRIEASQSAYYPDTANPEPVLAYRNQLIIEGNSQDVSFLNNEDTESIGAYLEPRVTDTAVRVVAYSGHALLDHYLPRAVDWVTPYRNAELRYNGVFLGGPVNDLHLHPGRSAAAIYADYQTYVAARRAEEFYPIILSTPLPNSNNGYITVGDIQTLLDVADLLRADKAGADGLVDYYLSPELRDPTDSLYFLDGTHETPAGAVKMGELILAEWNRLTPEHIMLAPFTIAGYQGDQTPAELWFLANRGFLSAEGVIVPQSSVRNPAFRQAFPVTLAGSVISGDGGPLHPTATGSNPRSRYTVELVDDEAEPIKTIFGSLEVEGSPDPITFGEMMDIPIDGTGDGPVTIAGHTFTAPYLGNRTPTKAVLRYDKTIVANDGTIVASGSRSRPGFEHEFDVTLEDTLLSIGEGIAYPTAESSKPNSKCRLILKDDAGDIQAFFTGLVIPASPLETNWTAILAASD